MLHGEETTSRPGAREGASLCVNVRSGMGRVERTPRWPGPGLALSWPVRQASLK